jgi:diphthine synthase
MSELVFVGAGLGDEQDLSRRAVDLLRKCELVFVEEYTSVLVADSVGRLESELGRPLVRLDRPRFESGREVLDALAHHTRVGVLVAGDPFAATTHVALRLEAEAQGHTWVYLPGPSVFTAAPSFLGLSQYRFGRTVSIPFPTPKYRPSSPLEAVSLNRASNLHTLVLLDLDPAREAFLTPAEALAELLGPASGLSPSTWVAVVARVGRPDARAWYGSIDRLRAVDVGRPLHSIVVPAPELHFLEAAALERFRVD